MFDFKETKGMNIKLKEDQYKLSTKEKINKALQMNEVFGYDIFLNDVAIGFAMLKNDDGCYFCGIVQ